MKRVHFALSRVPLPLAALAVLIVAAGGARLTQSWHLGFPICTLRALTGVPCPTCGATRTLLAWSHGEMALAFRFNPLVAAACLALAAWSLLWAFDALWQRRLCQKLCQRLKQAPWPALLIGALLVNWVYLLLNLPR